MTGSAGNQNRNRREETGWRLRRGVVWRRGLSVLLTVIWLAGLSAGLCVLQTEHTAAAGLEDRPLDMVVVVDNSGSMNRSDRDRMIGSAIRMLVNMMPCDSQVGVIGFNSQPTVLTHNAAGEEALVRLETMEEVGTIRSAVEGMVYDGHTGIGNALLAATQLLEQKGRSDAQKAIILFTDGLDDLESEVEYHTCDSNQTDAVYWAGSNSCPIYSIGLNYVKDDGTSTLGENGEGTQKLGGISSLSGGVYTEISDISQVEQLFLEILAEIRQLYNRELPVVPGDGGTYEVPFTVSSNVAEVNIRIGCQTADALSAGTITLTGPDGVQKELDGDPGIRTDQEATAYSIKVIEPEAGEWRLTLSGIVGEDVRIGMLEHTLAGLEVQLEESSGAVTDTAYQNAVVTVRAFVTSSGARVTDEEPYQDSELTVTAVAVPRTDPSKEESLVLTPQGASFEGSFSVETESIYDITVRMETPSYYRESTCVLLCANQPFVLDREKLAAEYAEIVLNVRSQVVMESLVAGYTSDNEGDPVAVSVEYQGEEEVAELQLEEDADRLVIQGRKWGSAIAILTFTDAQKNTEVVELKIKVQDPLLLLFLIGGPIFLAAGIAAVLLFGAYQALKRYPGELTVKSVSWEVKGERIRFSQPETLRTVLYVRAGKNLWGILDQYARLQELHGDSTVEENLRKTLLSTGEDARALRHFASELKLCRTLRGRKGILLKAWARTQVAVGTGRPAGRLKRWLLNGTITLTVTLDSEGRDRVTVELVQSNAGKRRGGRASRLERSQAGQTAVSRTRSRIGESTDRKADPANQAGEAGSRLNRTGSRGTQIERAGSRADRTGRAGQTEDVESRTRSRADRTGRISKRTDDR